MGMCAGAGAGQPAGAEYLSDSHERIYDSQQSWGVLGFDIASHVSGQAPLAIRIKDTEYAKGIGTHANSEIVIGLDGEYESFEAEVGAQWQEGTEGSVVFHVVVDGKELFKTGVMRRDDPAVPVHVPVKGAMELKLLVDDAGNGITCDGANWAEARLIRDPSAKPDVDNETRSFEIAPFARVVTCDPRRADGCRTNRLEEFRADDLFLETELLPASDGSYAVPDHDGLGCIGLQWAERRIPTEIALDFPGPAPTAEGAQVEYWSSEGRMDDWATIGQTLWQGKWAALPGRLEAAGDRWVFHIDSATPEFKSRAGTHKIRWIIPDVKAVTVRKLSAVSRSRWRTGEFSIELERPTPGEHAAIEVYNGYIAGTDGQTKCDWDLGSPLRLKLDYVSFPRLPDRTVIRVALPGQSFGIAVQDILTNGCVYVRDLGVFATAQPAKMSLAEYRKSIDGRKTILDRVREMPDQTFSAAKSVLLNPMSVRDPLLLSLACDNRKFVVSREGAIQFNTEPDEAMPSHALQYAYQLIPKFGTGKNDGLARHLEDVWMPIPVTETREAGVTYSQRTFVAPSDKHHASGLPEWLDAKPLCVSEFTIRNPRGVDADASLELTLMEQKPKGPWETESYPGRTLQTVSEGALLVDGELARLFIDTAKVGPLAVAVNGNTLTISGKLPAKSSARLAVYIPAWDLQAREYASLRAGSKLLPKVKAYWKRQLAGTMQIDVPEPLLEDVFTANQVHAMLAARNVDNGARIAPWAASSVYGPLDTEAQPVVLAMDLLGHHDFARRCHDYFLSRYNPKGYLANGYTVMGTGQSLWTIGEHYALTRDNAWLTRVAPELTRTCDWIAAQRTKSEHLDANGSPMPEYGLMPPGVLADWERYSYYFYANGYYDAGMAAVARSLKDAGIGDGSRIGSEAAKYRNDILRAYRWNQARMPALPLSDGTWIPAYPSSMYCFGLTRDFYKGVSSIGHDVEVGGNHLICQGVIDSGSRDAKWITDYMEDNWFFLYPGLANYPEDKMKADWFTYGGFAKLQPYYVRNADIYAMQDEVKPFIRTYFNSFFPMLSTETLAFWEHFSTQGAWNKTHESAWMLEQTRTMLLTERGNDLWLAPFVTNNWMKDGMHISVKDAPSKFGKVGYRVQSHVASGYIEATIDPPTRNAPDHIVLRLRHPEGKRMARVLVNGEEHTDFDPVKECVKIRSRNGTRITVRAEY